MVLTVQIERLLKEDAERITIQCDHLGRTG